MRISDTELEEILATGESYRVECKGSMAESAPRSIREAVCAFANDLPASKRSGIVFIGVDDSRRPVGLTIDDQLLLQLADIKSDGNILPLPTMFAEKRRVGGLDVAVITVLPSDSPPVRY